MRTVIMGAGAMGSLFGGLLAFSGEEVWLVDVRKEQVEVIRSVGLTIEEGEKLQIINVNITHDVASIGKADLVIFFVKTYQTEQAVSDALVLEKEDTIFLTLQNGLGNEEVLCDKIDRKKVMLGITGQGATFLGPGHIRHAGWGKTYIGEPDPGGTDRAARVAEMFRYADIDTEVSTRIHDLLWEKLLVNVGINALTALTGFKNGELLEHPETVRLMEALVSEASEIATKKGRQIEGDPIAKVKAVAEMTRGNRSSMGQDFDFRRRTEIDAINGAVVREAIALGCGAPVNQAIVDLVKVMEKRFCSALPELPF